MKSKAVRLERLERMRQLAPRVTILEVYGWRDGKHILLETINLVTGERESNYEQTGQIEKAPEQE